MSSRASLATAALVGALAALAPAPAPADTLPAIITARAEAGLPADLAITAVHLPRSLAHLDAAPADVDVDFPGAARPGRASVRVSLRGGRARTVFVPVTIAAMGEVAIATHDLAVGALVTAADVRWERRPLDGRRAASPIGQQVNAAITAGEPVDDARLTAPPPVARGTEVRVEVRKGAITVTTRGRLETATRIGGTARIRTTSGAFVTGTLADRGLAIVEAP